MSRILAASVVLASVLTFAPFMSASPANGPSIALTVSAYVPGVCVFTTTSDTVNFGTYDPIAANASAALRQPYSARYRCTQSDATDPIEFAFSGANQTGGQCRMKGGTSTDFLNYNIKDSASVDFPCDNTVTSATRQSADADAGGATFFYDFTFTLPGEKNTVQTETDTLTVTSIS